MVNQLHLFNLLLTNLLHFIKVYNFILLNYINRCFFTLNYVYFIFYLYSN